LEDLDQKRPSADGAEAAERGRGAAMWIRDPSHSAWSTQKQKLWLKPRELKSFNDF
jgi:hypothetical protein